MERPNLEEEKIVAKIKSNWTKSFALPGPFSGANYGLYISPDGKYSASVDEDDNEIAAVIIRDLGKVTTELSEILIVLKNI